MTAAATERKLVSERAAGASTRRGPIGMDFYRLVPEKR
jgi:hypothetical protein